MDTMEHNFKDAIETMKTKITQVDEEICYNEELQKVLHSKCIKQKLELERFEKRLSSLQNVK